MLTSKAKLAEKADGNRTEEWKEKEYSYKVWENGKPTQLEFGDTKVYDLLLDWKWY